MVEKIVLGGQLGADLGGLRAARSAGIATGGSGPLVMASGPERQWADGTVRPRRPAGKAQARLELSQSISCVSSIARSTAASALPRARAQRGRELPK